MRPYPSFVACSLLAVACWSGAADRPIAGDRLVLKDPANANRRALRFKAAQDTAIDPGTGADPRVGGATLEVRGGGPGEGDSGSIELPAGRWTGLGNPAGAKGYRYLDKGRPGGVRTAVLEPGSRGGRLTIAGGGSDWAYAVTRPQALVDVRLTVGDDIYCARFTTFEKNGPGKVKAKAAAAPVDCSAPPAPTCGDGLAEGSEECDDGGTTSGDGCSATCQLESRSALCAGVPATPGTALASVLVASGLSRPVHVTAPPLDPHRIFIVEQNGLVKIVKNGAILPRPFLDLVDESSCCGERGLLSLAFHPDYESNGLFFVNYTNTAGNTEVRRFRVSANPDVADESTSTLVIAITQDFANHNGGQIAFGPDGFLYVGMGDGGGGGDPNERAQDPGQLLGKILRLDVNATSYAIPPTNPFVGAPPLDEIWALGTRNPWRFSFDRGSGDLYVADVGQNHFEEVNVQTASSTGGENYGWDVFEGNSCFEPTPPATDCPAPPAGFTFPVLVYDHSVGCSITGGFVYRGCRMPDLRGTYFYGDACSAWVKTFRGVSGGVAQNPGDVTADIAPGGGLSIGALTSFGEDARGELYLVDYAGGSDGQGEVYRLVPE